MPDNRITLHATAGPRHGQRLEVARETTVGRADVDLVFDDEQISRRHLRLRPIASGLVVEDLGSTNGTRVNDRRIAASTTVGDGARISFGSTTVVVELPAHPPAATVVDVPGQQTQLRPGARPPAHVPVAAPAPPPLPPLPVSPTPSGPAWPPLPTGKPLVPDGARSGPPRPALALAFAGLGAAIAVAAVLGLNQSSTPKTVTVASAAAAAPTASVGSTTGIAVNTSKFAPADNAGTRPLPSGTGTSPSPDAGLLTANGPTGSFACVAATNSPATTDGAATAVPGPGHFRFITSACENANSLVATFPLHKGISGGQTVYYVITDDSNPASARSLGVNYVPKLANAIGSPAVQKVTMVNGEVDFPATVDFAHTRVLVPGANGFPPAQASPSAVADPGYSPLVELPDGTVMNAEQLINSTGHAAKVVAVDYANMSVSYLETEGRYEDKHVHYASFDSGMMVPAAIEDVTYTPLLNMVPKLGDEGLHSSARETLVAFVNGPADNGQFSLNPQRQGENSTALGQGDPHNILHETPTIPDHGDVGDITYAPMWDVHFAEWTPSAIANGDQVELQSTDEVFERLGTDDLSQVPSDSKAVGAVTSCEMSAQECQTGLITGPGGAKFGPSGFVVNCPLISIDIP